MSKDANKNTHNNTRAAGAKYTRLTLDDIYAILERAQENAAPFICSEDFDERAGLIYIEEDQDRPGTFFVGYSAETWRKAEAFQAAFVGAAWAAGHFAEVQTRWADDLVGVADGHRRVSVYVAAADVKGEDGLAVA